MRSASPPGLDDRAAAAARRGAAATLARRWRDQPPLVALRDRLVMLDRAAVPPDRAALLDAARPLIADIGWIETAVAAAARLMRDDPYFEPPLRTLNPDARIGLMLFDDQRLRITVQTVPLARTARHKIDALGPRSIAFPGISTLTRVLRAGGAELALWHAAPADMGFSAATAGRARPAGRIALMDGMQLAFDGAREAWSIARQTGDIVLLQASAIDDAAPLAVEYDAATGGFLSAAATDNRIARMQLMATLLRLMRRRDAAPLLAELAIDGPFFLRWQMMRELLALSPETALPLLRRMAADDDHHEIRAAAMRTLRLLAA